MAFRTQYSHFKYQMMFFFSSGNADIRFASERLNRMQTIKRAKLFLYQSFPFKLCNAIIQAYQHDVLSGLPALRYFSSTRKTIDLLVKVSVPTGKSSLLKVGRIYPKRLWLGPKLVRVI